MDRISSSFDLPHLGIAARWARSVDRTIVFVTGEIDIASVTPLHQAICAAVGIGEQLVLDLSGVTFCGAAGVDLFARLRDQMAHAGGRLVLRDPSAMVRRILEVTQLAGAFEIEARRRPTRHGGT